RRFKIPVSDKVVDHLSFYRPSANSSEIKYLQERREALGGPVPERVVKVAALKSVPDAPFKEFFAGSKKRPASTTMVFVRILTKLLADNEIGSRVVPIIPDEGRTFGMEALFRKIGIYSHVGQHYTPVDRETLLYYREATDGQILEEGITEAGAMSSFIAAGTSYASNNLTMFPFFIYYSMFGFQRIGDLIWAAGDMRCKGFLIGATAGRTTLAGEGLQHQDGNTQLFAFPYPNIVAYDPAFAYELAIIIREGMRRMYVEMEDCIFYLTVGNENYPMPAMPEGVEEGVIKGMYCFKKSDRPKGKAHVRLLGSGAILLEALRAQEILEENYWVTADVWSVTSFKNLYNDGLDCDRRNRLNATDEQRVPYIAQCLTGDDPVVAATDYVQAVPLTCARWIKAPFKALGTDGFGRSEARKELRDFFEVDGRHITITALNALARAGTVEPELVKQAVDELGIDPEKSSPRLS
ncbi:MAG: pyruvate dehydrogenase (acetyl-transferring), homodimeric type, partial [Deltaproteobacteria bacterium]|nr:pyruvate dehydrogenase (acetyl-transferring), homodimeric type [Deltaproteobacteria bacterium]